MNRVRIRKRKTYNIELATQHVDIRLNLKLGQSKAFFNGLLGSMLQKTYDLLHGNVNYGN